MQPGQPCKTVFQRMRGGAAQAHLASHPTTVYFHSQPTPARRQSKRANLLPRRRRPRRQMDRLSTERRSWLMSRVGAKNTAPELMVRRMVHAMGYRYRLHGKSLPGKPDLVFASRRKAIFVHGCFWHGHEGCRYARLPKSRVEFWADKQSANRSRDERDVAELERAGWNALTVWQCELKNPECVRRRIDEFLGK
jgi:DNA mismatch endonuclease, patch repair protein